MLIPKYNIIVILNFFTMVAKKIMQFTDFPEFSLIKIEFSRPNKYKMQDTVAASSLTKCKLQPLFPFSPSSFKNIES